MYSFQNRVVEIQKKRKTDRYRNALGRVSCQSDKHRNIFSEIVGYAISIEAYPTEVVIYLAVVEIRSQTSKEFR